MRFIVVLLITFFFSMSYAQAPGKFYARYGGNGYDVGYDVKQTLDKGYIITGLTSSMGLGNTDMYLLKLDSMGNVKFQNTFGNASNDIGKTVIQLPDSSYIMVGYTNSIGFGGYDIFLVKADKYGMLQWQNTIGGTDWDFANSMQQTSDGGFIIAGSTYSYGYGNEDGYVIRIDAIGNIMWTKTFGGIEDDAFKSVIQTTDGGFALCGTTKSYGDTNGDAWVFKLTSNGDSVWSKIYGGIKEDFVNQIIQLQNGDVLAAGGTKSTASLQENLNICYNILNGNLIFDYADPGTKPEYYNSCTEGLNGYFVGCGKSTHNVYGDQGLIEVYSTGFNYLNFFPIAIGNKDELFSVTKTKDKGFAFVGVTQGASSTLQDVFFVKTDSTGSYGNNITSINNNFEKVGINISIYPNPTISELFVCINYINYSSIDALIIRFLDIKGSEVLKIESDQILNRIDIKDLNQGIYFVQILFDNILVKTDKISIIK